MAARLRHGEKLVPSLFNSSDLCASVGESETPYTTFDFLGFFRKEGSRDSRDGIVRGNRNKTSDVHSSSSSSLFFRSDRLDDLRLASSTNTNDRLDANVDVYGRQRGGESYRISWE